MPTKQTQDDTPKEPVAAKAAEAKQEEPAPVSEPTSYRVLKAITLGNGQTLGPGDTLAIADDDPEWPTRRPAQLVKQGYLRLQEG